MIKKLCIMLALVVFIIIPTFTLTAFADEPEETEYEENIDTGSPFDSIEKEFIIDTEQPTVWDGVLYADSLTPVENPFTPSGTGTVVDSATDEDGKLFFTITTPDEHIFYLVIDRQRGHENVYFLNAVTVFDLMALAEMPEVPEMFLPDEVVVTPDYETEADESYVEVPTQESQSNNNVVTYVIIGVLAVGGGGAAYYFKVYKPKQQGADGGMEYDPSIDDNDFSNSWDDNGHQNDSDDYMSWNEENNE